MHVAGLWQHPVQRSILRRAALRYAGHGWRIVPGAALVASRYICGPLCPTVACHPAVDRWESVASSNVSDVDHWWDNAPFSVLLCTGHTFDVIDVPERIGAPVARARRSGPVAVSPAGRWMFLVRPGAALRRELSARVDVVQHSAGSWIPAPPTRTPAGRIRWTIDPAATGWRLPDPEQVQSELLSHLLEHAAGPASGRHPARGAA